MSDHNFEIESFGRTLSPGYMSAPRTFVHGEGSNLFSESGQRFIDLCAGTMTNSLGHNHPLLVGAMRAALNKPWNLHDYSTPSRVEALHAIQSIIGDRYHHFHFYSGGSETIEAGCRALLSSLPEKRSRFLAFRHSYHGKTFLARQLSGWPHSIDSKSCVEIVDFPDDIQIKCSHDLQEREDRCLSQVQNAISNKAVGAVVCEPILGSSGSLEGSQRFWDRFQDILSETKTLLFVDEVFCGFGRAGANFYYEAIGLQPDIIAFAKGIGGGFPVMVLAGTKQIMMQSPFCSSGSSSTTFGGNPLALTAVATTISVYSQENLLQNVLYLEDTLSNELEELSHEHSFILGTRSRGLMGSLIFDNEAAALSLHRECIRNGLLVMTFDHVFRVAPALNISRSSLLEGLDVLRFSMSRLSQ